MAVITAVQDPFDPISGFDASKAVQLCAFFLIASKGRIDKLKLIKLLYLTEREYLARYEMPLLWDEYYSLPHGPICSSALNCIDKVCLSDISDKYFALHGRKDVHLVRGVSREDLDCLSDADVDVAQAVWTEHGSKTASQIRNYTHTFCKEYTQVDRGRIQIRYEEILEAVGSKNPAETAFGIESYRRAISRYA